MDMPCGITNVSVGDWLHAKHSMQVAAVAVKMLLLLRHLGAHLAGANTGLSLSQLQHSCL